MGDQHLLNSIALLERYSKRRHLALALDAGHFAATTGGEMAAEAAQEASDQLLDKVFERDIADECASKYDELTRERDRRKLTPQPWGEPIRNLAFEAAHPERYAKRPTPKDQVAAVVTVAAAMKSTRNPMTS